MFPTSYPQWRVIHHEPPIIDTKTGLEIQAMSPEQCLLDNLQCSGECISSFIHYGTSTRSIIDYDPEKGKCVLVQLEGPIMQCANCKRTIDTVTLGHQMPPKKTICPDIAQFIIEKVVKKCGNITAIADECGISRSTAEKLLRDTVNRWKDKVESYLPCSTLLFLPIRCGRREIMMVGGMNSRNEVLLYDLFPTYSQRGIKTTLNKLTDHLMNVKLIVIDLDGDAYRICRERCPNARIAVAYSALINFVGRCRIGYGYQTRRLSSDIRNCNQYRTVTQTVDSWYAALDNDDKNTYSSLYEAICSCGDAVDGIFDVKWIEQYYSMAAAFVQKFSSVNMGYDAIRLLFMTYMPDAVSFVSGTTSDTSSSVNSLIFAGSNNTKSPIVNVPALFVREIRHRNIYPIYDFSVNLRKMSQLSDAPIRWEAYDISEEALCQMEFDYNGNNPTKLADILRLERRIDTNEDCVRQK